MTDIINSRETKGDVKLNGLEFSDNPRESCSCCPKKAATTVTLWRSNHGTSFRLCGECAQELGIQLIRRT
jgi:hypothetical protein